MGISEKVAIDMLEDGKTLQASDLGFITTVFRDNATDDRMHKYYSLILELLEKEGA